MYQKKRSNRDGMLILFLIVGLLIGYIIGQSRMKEDGYVLNPSAFEFSPMRNSEANKSIPKKYDPVSLLNPLYTLEMDENGELYSPYEDIYKEEHKKELAWKDNDIWDWENDEKERLLWH